MSGCPSWVPRGRSQQGRLGAEDDQGRGQRSAGPGAKVSGSPRAMSTYWGLRTAGLEGSKSAHLLQWQWDSQGGLSPSPGLPAFILPAQFQERTQRWQEDLGSLSSEHPFFQGRPHSGYRGRRLCWYGCRLLTVSLSLAVSCWDSGIPQSSTASGSGFPPVCVLGGGR